MDRDGRSASLERPVNKSARALPGCDRPEDARHPEPTRARGAGAGGRPEVVAATARIASRRVADSCTRRVVLNFPACRFFLARARCRPCAVGCMFVSDAPKFCNNCITCDPEEQRRTRTRWAPTPTAALRRCLSCGRPNRMRARDYPARSPVRCWYARARPEDDPVAPLGSAEVPSPSVVARVLSRHEPGRPTTDLDLPRPLPRRPRALRSPACARSRSRSARTSAGWRPSGT